MSPIEQQQPTAEEPMGIVISRGSREAPTPRVSAFVWGPVPPAARPERAAAPAPATNGQKAA
jgi:hypothetical protein